MWDGRWCWGVWRQENLRVPSRNRSTPKTLADPTARVEPAACPNDVWALDFQFDSDYHGRSIKVCNVMDEFTREHVGFTADSAIDAAAVVELLDVIACERGQRPRVVRMDNGPEIISKTLRSWAAEEETVQAFIPPGQLWHNGFVESLHNRMRDELFSAGMLPGFGTCPLLHRTMVSQVQYVSSSLGAGIHPTGGIQEAVFKHSRLNQLDLKSSPPDHDVGFCIGIAYICSTAQRP